MKWLALAALVISYLTLLAIGVGFRLGLFDRNDDAGSRR